MSGPGRLHAFKLDRRGLARVFGELEATVMEAVWALESATVADVCDRLDDSVHYKTLMTVMNRLVDKGALERRRRSRAYVYSTAETREAFMTRVSRRVVEGLVLDFGDAAVAQMVDALEDVDPALILRLRALADSAGEAEAASQTDDGADDVASPTDLIGSPPVGDGQ